MDDNTLDPNAHKAGDIKGGDSAPGGPPYAPGWCSMHIVQYQRDEDGVGGVYNFDVTLYDANDEEIGGVHNTPVDGTTFKLNVDSALPNVMVIYAPGPDSDPLTFSYGSQTWKGNDASHQCNIGTGPDNGYQDGNRDGDCGFTC